MGRRFFFFPFLTANLFETCNSRSPICPDQLTTDCVCCRTTHGVERKKEYKINKIPHDLLLDTNNNPVLECLFFLFMS